MKPALFSVKNSLFINLVSFLLIIVGGYYWMNMQQEAFPNVSFDMVTVTTAYLGATPHEIEKLITIPIEDELEQVDDIEEIKSFSVENFSTILIQIDPDTDNKNKVIQDIQTAVDRVQDLPDDIEDDPIVTEIQTKNMPVIRLGISSQNKGLLRDYADSLKDKLQDIDGVASIRKEGWNDREIRVNADPTKVHDYYLSLDEIIAALRNKNLNLPGGTLESKGSEYLVRTMGEFETAEEVENVIIRANEEGNWIRVKDIAEVEDDYEDNELMFKSNGKESIILTVIKRESGDIIKVVNDVKETIAEFEETNEGAVQIETFDDMSYYVKRRLNVLINNGLIGIVLVVVCLLLFLRPRVAIVTAIGLPVAFGTTLILMSICGISINLISMFGMIIVLGMLVDDGIIIAENSYRYIEKGYSPKEAAIKGTNEVTKPVIATILTTFAFFAPLFAMKGIMGKYIRHIPQVVILMLVASLIEALFILPSHIADFVKKLAPKAEKKERLGDRFFNMLLKHYKKLLTRSVKHRYISIGIIILISIGAVVISAKYMKFKLFSSEGMEEFYITARAPIGTPLEKTAELLEPVEDIIGTLPDEELDNFVTMVGQAGDRNETETGSYAAQINVYLTPVNDRKRKTLTIIDSLREKCKNIQGFDELTFEEVAPGPPVGKPIAVEIRGDDFDTLSQISTRVQDFLGTIDGVKDIKDDYTAGKQELRVIVDEEKATRVFLSVRDVANAVRYAFDGAIATTIKTTDEEIDVRVQFPEKDMLNFDVFDKILVNNKYNKLIPLKKVAELQTEEGISSIKHLDRKRLITVTANVLPSVTTSLEVNRMLQKEFKSIHKEYLDTTVSYGGEQEDSQESMTNLLTAFVWGIMIVFLILASTFGSLVQPFIVSSSIPLGIVGVIFAFYFHGTPFGFMSIMGSIGLSGVAVNDAIVLVEFINNLRKEGHSREESIIMGGTLRLRPVLLTTITTVAGVFPIAYGWGGSDPFLKPMGLALSWGLIFATGSTLIVIPCIYAVVDDIRWAVRRFAKKEIEAIEEKLHLEYEEI